MLKLLPPGPVTPRHLGRLLLRLWPLAALAAGLYLLTTRFEAATLWPALAAITSQDWARAAVFCALSYLAIGRTEQVLHAICGSGIGPVRARRAGMVAGAVSQAIGFGGVTGALARWRRLPDLGPLGAARVGLAGSALFMAALVMVGAGLNLPDLGPATGPSAVLLAVIAVVLIRLKPGRALPGFTPWRALAYLTWVLADVVAAGAAFYILLPGTAEIGFAPVLAAYALALGAGLISQSPGGIGAFDLALLALLPGLVPAEVMAALIAYRVVYHVVPAALAGLVLLRPGRVPRPPAFLPATGTLLERALARAPHPDWGLVRQGAQVLLSRDQEQGWLVRTLPERLVTLGPPLGRADLTVLAAHARDSGRGLFLYKCDGVTAQIARKAGWRVLRIANEAVLDPLNWSDAGPACRQLRRKLRAADTAGLRVQVATDTLPWPEMAAIAADWSRRGGGERGFSMGRFDPVLLNAQLVVLGWHEGRLAGFITVNVTQRGWGLDLMRSRMDAPDGTMHALVTAAIAFAAGAGARRFSLAAFPEARGWTGALLRQVGAGRGLAQFKRAFAPRILGRYVVAPGWGSLAAGLISVTWAVHRPAPLPEPPLDPAAEGAAFRLETQDTSCDAIGPEPQRAMMGLFPARRRRNARPPR